MQELQIVASEFIRAVSRGSPELLDVADKVASGDLGSIKKLNSDPCAFTNHEDYWSYKLVTSFLKKCDNLPGKVDTQKAAFDTWLSCEKLNAKTNARLLEIQSRLEYPLESDSRTERKFWTEFRNHFRNIVGKPPSTLSGGKFTKGSTYSNHGLIGKQLQSKIITPPTVTSEAVLDLIDFETTIWSRLHNDSMFDDVEGCHHVAAVSPVRGFQIVRGERFDTVPKTSETDRPIGIQPSGNLFAQKAIGDRLRTRLNRIGLLLTDKRPDDPLQEVVWILSNRKIESAEDKHRRLARQGSLDGSIATIDLSNASELICYMLVKLLSSPEWFELLDTTRCAFSEIEISGIDKSQRGVYRLQKFSSMGNGFTFELETAIFYSLLLTVVPSERHQDLSVYGDDMLLPSEYFDDAIAALSYIGFVPNKTKSYGTGPFRESCGGDYFHGYPVRPIFVRDVPCNPLDWIVIHNQIATLCDHYPVQGVLNTIRGLVPRNVRQCIGPSFLGDCVFHDRNSETNRTKDDGLFWYRAVLPMYDSYPRDRWCENSNVAASTIRRLPEKVDRTDLSPGYRIAKVCAFS